MNQSIGLYQWAIDYPGPNDFATDIENNALWVAVLENVIVGVVALTIYSNDDYLKGGCNNDIPAVTSHRLAVDPSVQGKGIGSVLLNLAEEVAKNYYHFNVVRIDTHAQNLAMQHLIAEKFKYKYMGIIHLSKRPGEVRNWYEKSI